MSVQGYTFIEGLIMLAIDVILLAFLGYYLDQVLPKQYGIVKPWNFLCKRTRNSNIDDINVKVHQNHTTD